MFMDSFNRHIDYVRLSLTDRCNFQCFYCRPQRIEHTFFPDGDYLNEQDIKKLFLALGELGVKKVKLTGGEPLLRKDICKIIEILHKNPHLEDISLTTNGFFLEKLAQELKNSGLHRLNISLDSLRPDIFQSVTETPSFHKVWRGILKALEVGFKNIKLNVVLLKGINEEEVNDFVDLTLRTSLIVRFIEFMPTKRTQLDHDTYFLSHKEIISRLEKRYQLIPDLEDMKTGPSRYYKVNGQGRIGFISPLSHNFCDRCNRIRITAKGQLRLCLFSQNNIDLLSLIRSSHLDNSKILKDVLQESLKIKPLRHDLENKEVGNLESFVSIGG